MSLKKTLILGASDNPGRYSYLALNKLKAYGHEVVAIGKRKTQVNGTAIEKEMIAVDNIHTITLYLNAANQQAYYDYILSLKPERIIFNPGTENSALEDLATEHGIEAVEACTLVMLSTNQY
jgi:hypothetical protein